jgi:hypothetical protein
VFKRENRSKGISTVRNLYLTTISKDVMDWEVLMYAVVICTVCKLENVF